MASFSSDATWKGNLPDGSGTMTVGDNHYTGPFTFASRFKDGDGTNPEELIAAAHAGCFSMAFSNELAQAGYTPDRVNTDAEVHLEEDGEGGFHIPRIKLTTKATVPGIDDDTFQKIAMGAKENCPVSKLYAGADITLDASLV